MPVLDLSDYSLSASLFEYARTPTAHTAEGAYVRGGNIVVAHIEHLDRKQTRYGRIREVPGKRANEMNGNVFVAASRPEVRSGLSK